MATPYPLRVDAPVLLAGGGTIEPEALERAQAHAQTVVAADGGADRLAALGGPTPQAVIGDLDSLADAAHWRALPGVTVLEVPEQDTTDFEKCLYSVEAPLFLGVGFFGPRIDHTLAALHTLLRRADKRVILVSGEEIAFLAPQAWRCALPAGARVSVWPARPVQALSSQGLRWPLDGLAFESGVRIGTSNEALGGLVEARFDRLGAVILLEATHLDAALDGLRAVGP